MKTLALAMAIALLAAAPVLAASPIDGKWSGESQMRMGPQMLTLDIKADGKNLVGTLQQADHPAGPINGGKVDGAKFWFENGFDMQGRHVAFKWSGEVKGGELQLTREVVMPEGTDPANQVPALHVTMTRVK